MIPPFYSADGDYPAKVFFGRSDENVADIRQGSYLESNEPIHVIYEVIGSEDEHNLMGAPAHVDTFGPTAIAIQ
jgi:hypothetical protein